MRLDSLVKIERGPNDDVELGIGWDFAQGQPKIDLDLQAVLFDATGTILDACYYQQLAVSNGAVKHSGDNKTGEGAGDDEMIKLDLDAIDPACKVICFVVSAQSGTFEHVESARWELRDIMPNGKKILVSDSLY
jgi:tellurium resistance protein TerZ